MSEQYEVFRLTSEHSIHYHEGQVYLVTNSAPMPHCIPEMEYLGQFEANNDRSAMIHAQAKARIV